MCLFAVCSVTTSAAHSLHVEVSPKFGTNLLRFDTSLHRTTGGQDITVSRLDFILSNFALRTSQGTWSLALNRFAYISGRDGRTRFILPGIEGGSYNRVRFNIGVPAKENHAKPGQFDPSHPLNPNVNGLHWSWQGGYVFLALEGSWSKGQQGYSFHIATDKLLTNIELPLNLTISGDSTLSLDLDVNSIFSGPHQIILTNGTASTHSRDGDDLADRLSQNLATAFVVSDLSSKKDHTRATVSKALGTAIQTQAPSPMALNATPYRFTFPEYFPRPELPRDNPLTIEGIELGRQLFHDPRLSKNNQQSCASCHQRESAFVDAGRRFSIGVDGHFGTRNSMPLFNLAWKQQFFWDGRAPSLRAQVLMPIENPIEMHETLPNVVIKLSVKASNHSVLKGSITNAVPRDSAQEDVVDYSAGFAAAFGSPEISADRVARALEQFLLAQVSRNSKFDRAMAVDSTFTEEEQRGFTLFHTEYDPRRNQFGADCFHCHGGALFQSQSFANNGLDSSFGDSGRFEVTRREGDRGKFAVPSLRNVALTSPYMHDGRFATLEDVIVHYSTGVRRSSTLDPNMAKHPDGGMPLSESDRRALIAFLHTLTDE